MNGILDFRQTGKTVIALSGSIASGKSAALEEFKALGAETICADELASKYRAVLKDKIKLSFGTNNQKDLAQLIFEDKNKLKELENMLHPLIFKEAREIIKNSTKKIIVFAVPLLFEKGIENGFNLTICIYSSYKKRLKRAILRGTSETYFKWCEETQLPMAEKAERADIIIFNEGPRVNLRDKITRLFANLKNNDEENLWKTMM